MIHPLDALANTLLDIEHRLKKLEAAPPNQRKPALDPYWADIEKKVIAWGERTEALEAAPPNHEHKPARGATPIFSKQFDDGIAQLHRRIDAESERLTKAVNGFSKAWQHRDETKYLELSARQDELANEYSALDGKYTEAYARMAETMRDFKTEIFEALKSHHMRIMDLEEGPIDKPGNGFLVADPAAEAEKKRQCPECQKHAGIYIPHERRETTDDNWACSACGYHWYFGSNSEPV